jgi:RNA-binding protein
MNKEEIHNLKPALRVGKNGLTENTIKEIKNHLKKKRLIKVKILPSFIEGKNKKELANEIAKKTDSTLIKQVGFVIILDKREN